MPPLAPQNGLTARLLRRSPEMAAAVAGLVWFLAIGGHRAIHPASFDWIRGDAAQNVMGWLFFRSSAWGFPLGRIDGFVWPTGTTVGFTDANALLAVPFKLVSAVLPTDFQYVGLWLAVCFALQGWIGARLTALASEHALDRALGGVFFVLSPPLLARVGHYTLSSHFALLALLLFHLRPASTPAEVRRALLGTGIVTVITCALHPYLTAMALGIALSLPCKLWLVDRSMSCSEAARAATSLFMAPVAALALLGFFTSAPSHGLGYGPNGTDLLAIVNSGGSSWIVPPFLTEPWQWEGNAYLGLGGILLVLVAGGVALVRWRPRRHQLLSMVPLTAVCAFFLVFALSDVIRIAGHELLDLRWFYKPLRGITGPFRAWGRFAWPAYYLTLTGTVTGVLVLCRRRPGLATGLLTLAVALQLLDLAPRSVNRHFEPRPWRPRDPTWELARGNYDHLALVPPQVVGVLTPCRGLLYGDDEIWHPIAYEAYALGMTVNSGYVSRGPAKKLAGPCVEMEQELEAGVLRERTIYVVHDSKLPAFERASASCGQLDGFTVCVRPAQGNPFATALTAGAPLGAQRVPAR